MAATTCTAIFGLVTAAGCSGSGVHEQSGPSTTPAGSPSATASQTDQRAGEAAVAQVIAYERMLDDLALHPSRPLDRLYSVATQPDVTDEIGYLNHFRGAHNRQVCRARVVSTKVDAVVLGEASSAPAEARVTACLYVGDVHVYDRTGKSIVAKSRKPYYLTHLTLVMGSAGTSAAWLVKKVTATEVASCS